MIDASKRAESSARAAGASDFDSNRERLMADARRGVIALGNSGTTDEVAADRAAHAIAEGRGPGADIVPAGPPSMDRGASPMAPVEARTIGRAVDASRGQALGGDLRHEYEQFFGGNLSSVRVHTDEHSEQASRMVKARAFTIGDSVFLGPNHRLESHAGRRLLAHEVAHTRQPHRTAGAIGTPILRRQNGHGTQPPAPATLDSLIRVDPPGFTDQALDRAYQSYRSATTNAADPRTWALRQTVGEPRTRLEQLLGADYARGQAGVPAAAIDVSRNVAPGTYDAARISADVNALNANPQALNARLQNLGQSQPDGQVSAGHLNILQGNVAEILARPMLEQALQQVRQEAPDAQLFMGVQARILSPNGPPSDLVAFSDGLIAAVRPGGLQIFRVAEIKSGAEGGVQAQEQIHRWIEAHSTEGIELLLPGVPRTFTISNTVREVVGLARAPRIMIAPRGASFSTERSGHGVGAPVQRLELAQSAEEVNYLTRVVAQQMLQVQRARRMLAQARSAQLSPATLERVEELQSPAVVRRLLAQNGGTALVRGELYRVSIEGTSVRAQVLQPTTMTVPRALPAGDTVQAATAGGAATLGRGEPATPLGTGSGRESGSPATQTTTPALPGPGGGGTPPTQVPLAVPATGVVPPNIINFSGNDIVVGNRVVAPSPEAEIGTLREGELVVIGFDQYWAVGDLRTRQPIAGVFEGGQWYRVVSGGRALPLDAEGRIRSEAEPIPFAELPAVAQTRPPAGPGETSAGGGIGTGPKIVAGGLGIIMLANEILGPIGAVLQQQRRNIEFGRAEINFWLQFGANPTFGVWDQNERTPLPADATPDTSILGSPSFPYVANIDVAAFRAALPGKIANHHDFLLFLDLAKTLDTIIEDPLMPKEPSPEERRQPRRYYALVNKHDPNGRIRYDITDTIVQIRDRTVGQLDDAARARVRSLSEAEQRNIFRLRQGSETPLFRSARGGQPILSDQQLLGDNPWVHPVGRRIEGSAWGWFRYAGGGNDRVLVEPVNADAARGVTVSVYAVKRPISDVLDEVRAGGREIIQRQPPDGRLESFVAGPDPEGARFGETRYYRHPEMPDSQTAAIGELRQFWVNGSDLEAVAETDVRNYGSPGTGQRTAP